MPLGFWSSASNVLPLLLVLGVILLICARQAWVWRCLSSRGTASPAVVEAVRRSRGGWRRVTYSFVVEGGMRCRGESAWPAWWLGGVEVGHTIGICYDSKNPRLSRIDHGGFKDWGIWWPWWPFRPRQGRNAS